MSAIEQQVLKQCEFLVGELDGLTAARDHVIETVQLHVAG